MAGKGDVKISIIGDAHSLVSALGKGSAAGSAFSGVFAGVGMAFGQNLMGMATKMASFANDSIDKFVNLGVQTRKVMRQTGLTAQESSKLISVARESGVAYEDLTKSLKIFDKQLTGGGPNLEDASKALKALGIESRDSTGKMRPMTELLGDTAEVFKELGDGVEATALAQKLFGKSGESMLPLLQQGREGISDITDAMDKYGLTLDDAGVKKALETKKAQRELSMVWEGLQVQVGEHLAPVLKDLSKWMAETLPTAIQSAKQWVTDHKTDIEEWGKKIKEMVEWAQENVPKMLETIKGIGEGLQKVLDPIVDTIQTITLKLAELNDKMVELQGGNKTGQTNLQVSDFAWGPFGAIKALGEKISGNAGGGFLQDGMGWVGENGPELRYTRGGQTSLLPASQSGGGMGGTPTILNDTIVVQQNGHTVATAERRRELSLT